MKVFADTSYFIALLNGRDVAHEEAVEFSRRAVSEVSITEFILAELGDHFCKAADRADFIALMEYIRGNPSYKIVPASSDLLARGFDLFAARPDKEWSLTDCTSFVAMKDAGITDALTTDRHFAQAGLLAD